MASSHDGGSVPGGKAGAQDPFWPALELAQHHFGHLLLDKACHMGIPDSRGEKELMLLMGSVMKIQAKGLLKLRAVSHPQQ